jgi:hypothetical protein
MVKNHKGRRYSENQPMVSRGPNADDGPGTEHLVVGRQESHGDAGSSDGGR